MPLHMIREQSGKLEMQRGEGKVKKFC